MRGVRTHERRWPAAGRRTVFILLVALLSSATARAATHLEEKLEPDLSAGLGAAPETLDRSTPRRSWRSLLDACDARRWEVAVHLLNLGDIREADRKALGVGLAEKLCRVLAVAGQKSAEGLDDTAVGPIAGDEPTNSAVVARLAAGRVEGEVWLRRVHDQASDQHVWLVTRRTVSEIPVLYQALVRGAAGGRKLAERGRLPESVAAATPRQAATSFARLAREGEYGEAARLLDTSDLPPGDEAPRTARRLAMVLRRIHPASFAGLSDDAMGAPERDVPYDEEVVAATKLDGGEQQVRLARYEGDGGAAAWLFSAATVAQVDALYSQLGYGWAGDHLPPVFFDWELWGVQLWQWLGLAGALVVGMLFGGLSSFVIRKLLLHLAALTRWQWDDAMVTALNGPLGVGFSVVGFLAASSFLALAAAPRALLLGLCKLTAILALGWFLMRLVDVTAGLLLHVFEQRDNDMGRAMVPVARKILKPILFVMILIMALQNVGMNVGGLLAGLGIGGLAFALAAKDTLANVFGSVAIAFDRPFKVGDFINVDGLLGTVEDVGLRSTKIRTLERTLVTIPNSQMADSKVENFAPRDRIRMVLTFNLQYDTTLDQVRYIVDELKRYLLVHPRVYQDGWRVRFLGYGASSLDVQVYCYLTSTDYTEFTGIQEAIAMDLGAIIEGAGAQFAYPSQTVYVGKDSHADGAKAEQAAAVVAERREAGELTLPEIPEALRDELRGRQSKN